MKRLNTSQGARLRVWETFRLNAEDAAWVTGVIFLEPRLCSTLRA